MYTIYSCGHLYHASCLGVSARDGPSLGITCVVCNKGSAPSGHTGRLPLAVSIVLYNCSRKFSLDRNFAKPSYLCVAEILGGINFTNAVKVT